VRTFREKLREEFEARRAVNPRYSLRAFAALVGTNHAVLSQIFKGNRAPPIQRIASWARKLGIEREEAAAYLMAAHVRKECDYGRHEQLRNWAAEAMSIVADRTHWQILRLCGSSEFQADCRWIANELSVRVDEVNLALSRLLRLRLLEMSGGGVWRDLSRSSQMTEREFRRLALGRVREMAAALERQP
jgi:hypothetical protein